MSRELFSFNGGVHPPEHKSESNTRPIHPPIVPRQLVIPLRQHMGTPAKPIVTVGERVLKGQRIAASGMVRHPDSSSQWVGLGAEGAE